MKISNRQILFFLACVAPVGKIVMLPAQLADASKNDLLFPLLVHYLLQAAAVFCVLLLAKRNMSLFELVENTFGRVVAGIVTALYAVFLLFAALLPLLEQKLFVQNIFYDTLPSLVAFAPFFVFSAYILSKPLGSHGRVWDILAPLSIVGAAGILLLSVGSGDYAALSPAGASGIGGFLRGTAGAFDRFFDAALLLPMLGKIEYKKGLAWKGAVCYLAGGAAVLFFVATFYAIFQETAINQLFAFTATSKYFSGIATLGRIDYLFIFLLALVLTFYTALPMLGSVECILQICGRKRYLPTVLAVVVSSVFLILALLLDYKFTDVLRVISYEIFWIFPVFTLVLPPFMLLLRRERHAV